MTDLSSFSKTEFEAVVSLPYKVGVWIGYAEDEDGEADDLKEGQVLEACLKAVAGLNEDKPFIKAVAAQALALRGEWPRWAAQAFQAPAAAGEVMVLLKGRIPEQNFKSYRAMIMEIAGAVARAHGEFSQYDAQDEGFFARALQKFRSLSHDDADHPMNVSPAEESALSELAEILRKS